MRITAELLERLHACPEEIDAFRAEWPDGCEANQESAERALARGLDLQWLGKRVLRAPAWAEYERVRAPAWAEYERVTAPALAEYERVTAPAWAEYQRVKAPAWAEYERVRAPAWAEYERVTAPALADLISDPSNWKQSALRLLSNDTTNNDMESRTMRATGVKP